MFSAAGKHESGTKSGGGENWLLRNYFTLKWNLSMHVNVRKAQFLLMLPLTLQCSWSWNGMQTATIIQLWKQPSNNVNGDFFHLIVSDICSYWSLDSIVHTSTLTTHLQENYPVPPHLPISNK